MSGPKVSVCMPVYNGAKFLPQAIESILNQTFADFELVIADDCSTDNSMAIIADYAAKDTRIRHWKNEKNLGLFGNWNLTMERANGQYIKPFAQDDYCKPNFFQSLVEALDKNPSVAIAGSAREFFNGEKVTAVEPDARKYYRDRIFGGTDVCLMFLVGGYNLVGFPPAMMFRKEHLDGGFDRRYYHCGDVEFFIRLLQKGDYYYLYRPLVTYRYHGQNQTYKNFAELKYMSDILLLQKDYSEFAESNGVNDFAGIIADQLANVVEVGRNYLNIDYRDLKDTEVLHDPQRAISIILSLADRVNELKKSAANDAVSPEQLAQLEQLAAEREKLMQDNRHLHHQIHSLVNSTSWKVTKPIRALKRLAAGR